MGNPSFSFFRRRESPFFFTFNGWSGHINERPSLGIAHMQKTTNIIWPFTQTGHSHQLSQGYKPILMASNIMVRLHHHYRNACMT